MRGAALSLALGVVACNGILGWEQAAIDPILLDADGNGPSCERYCALVTAACTGPQLQYLTPGICLSMCAVFDLGSLDDTASPSLGCRQHHAVLAASDPINHCPKAGPLGGGTCGDRCKVFCDLDRARCDTLAYATVAACVPICGGFAYDPALGVTRDQEKDTLNCRSYHLQAAQANDAARATHCPHTAKVSDICTP